MSMGPRGSSKLLPINVTSPRRSVKGRDLPAVNSTFDVRTGDHLTAPAPQGVSSYNVKIAGDDIHVESPEPSS